MSEPNQPFDDEGPSVARDVQAFYAADAVAAADLRASGRWPEAVALYNEGALSADLYAMEADEPAGSEDRTKSFKRAVAAYKAYLTALNNGGSNFVIRRIREADIARHDRERDTQSGVLRRVEAIERLLYKQGWIL